MVMMLARAAGMLATQAMAARRIGLNMGEILSELVSRSRNNPKKHPQSIKIQ
jgi:hypothetical protein